MGAPFRLRLARNFQLYHILAILSSENGQKNVTKNLPQFWAILLIDFCLKIYYNIITKGDKKMTKKQEQVKNKKQRVLVPFNTGTRLHKNLKYDKKFRRKNSKNLEKSIDN